MDMQNVGIKVPKQSIIYLGVCLSGILLFVLLGIIPNQYSLNTLEQKISTMKFKIEEQKALSPLYQSVSNWAQQKGPTSLPMPASGRLETIKMNMIPQTVRQIAKDNKMNMLSVVPDLKALAGEGQRLSVEVTVRGDFTDFRQFLIDLNAIPYIENMEEIQVEQEKNTQLFRVKLWIAVV
jgi:Tfp pilus assembly protein PilO